MIDRYNQSMSLVLKVAYRYYIEDLSQNEIADQLNISVTTVSRLIKKAKEHKIVEFVIHDSYIDSIRMEEALVKKFGLKDAVIASGVIGEDPLAEGSVLMRENAKKMVALEAARYLQRIIREHDVLGITWGNHVYNMINYLNPAQKTETTFVTLHGSIAHVSNELDVRTLVPRISKAFAGRHYTLMCEALTSSPKVAGILKKERSIREVFEMYNKVNISVCGIGPFYPDLRSVLARPDFISPDELQLLLNANVCGDLSLRFFDRDGIECDTELRDRMLAISMEQYKKIDTKIILASGAEKKEALRSAIKGKLVNVLIIDNQTASDLLEDPDTP